MKSFDVSQLASECFGGETTSKTYDSTAEKFMDMSFEKTNSAYMLFYEKRKKNLVVSKCNEICLKELQPSHNNLFKTIWDDNRRLIRDRYIFETSYFNFVWELCDSLPSYHKNAIENIDIDQVNDGDDDATFYAAKLAITFILDVYIHSRDKSYLINWNDLLMKLFGSSKKACKWFLTHLIVTNMYWCTKIFFKCPNIAMRHLFQRLLLNICINIFNEECELIESFMKYFLLLLEKSRDEKQLNIKFMIEFFNLLLEFARQGLEYTIILLKFDAIVKCAQFYVENRHSPLKKGKADTDKDALTNGAIAYKNAPVEPDIILLEDDETENETKTNEKNQETAEEIVVDDSSYLNEMENENHQFSDDEDFENNDCEAPLIMPLQNQKSKLKVFEKIFSFLSLLFDNYVKIVQNRIEMMSKNSNLKFDNINYKLKLNFFYKSIIDELNLSNIRSILNGIFCLNFYENELKNSHSDNNNWTSSCKENKIFAVNMINMCCVTIRRLQQNKLNTKNSKGNNKPIKLDTEERCVHFFSMLDNLISPIEESNEKQELNELHRSLLANKIFKGFKLNQNF